MPVKDHRGDGSRVADVVEGVAVEEDEIGELVRLDGAKIRGAMQEDCGIDRCGLECLKRSEAGGDKALQLAVQADSGKDIHSCGGVGSSEEGNSRGLQTVNDAKLMLDEVFAGREGIGVERSGDALCIDGQSESTHVRAA